MIRQFHCPQLPMFAVCRQPQAGARELLNIIGIDLEVTEVLFFDLVRSINCREPATGLDAEPALPREFWSTIAAILAYAVSYVTISRYRARRARESVASGPLPPGQA